MGTFVGRYTPIDVGRAASYDTLDEQAALFVTSVNAATHADALPDVSTGATAKWVSVPTVAAASTSGATTTYKDDTVIADGVVHLRVTAPDVDSTADLDCTADSIKASALGSMTVDGAMTSATTTECAIHSAESAVGAKVAAIIAAGSKVYLTVGDEAEIIQVTAVAEDNITFTIVRGAQGSTASSSWDDDEALTLYCGTDNTIIGMNDESVWGDPTASDIVVLCGTEQMHVLALAPGSVADTMKVTRGYDGTTAAVHADEAAVTRYYDENSTVFDVESGHGALLLDEAFYKFATGGTEVIQVKSISTDRITVERNQNNSATTVGPIADDTALFRCWGPEILDAALTAVNGTSGAPDFQEYGGPPVNTLGYNADGSAIWSSETQVEAT